MLGFGEAFWKSCGECMEGWRGNLLLWGVVLDDRCLERLLLGDERCEREIFRGLENENGRRIGLFLFLVLGHGRMG